MKGGPEKEKQGDRFLFGRILRRLFGEKSLSSDPGSLLLEIGRFFLGSPYVEGTLEGGGPEHVIINLREFDCVTFVETVVALSACVRSQDLTLESFRRRLGAIRYRRGRPEGYPSRLHYFSDWIHENQKKGILRDLTRSLGGEPLRKTVDFMTNHPEFYPPLNRPGTLEKMKRIERAIERRSLYFIPKTGFRRVEERIREGDILAITADTKGLDILHTGFAVKVKGRIHLLHASRAGGGVVLTRETLWRYLMRRKKRSGVVVARIRPSAP